MRVFSKTASVVLGVTMLSAGPVFAGGDKMTLDVSNGQAIFTQGKGDAPPCTSCHGDDAMGMEATKAPRLAGLGFTYIYKQLTNFSEFKRVDRTNAQIEFKGKTVGLMNQYASALNDQDRKDVAGYVNVVLNKGKFTPSTTDEIKGAETNPGEYPMGTRYRGKIIALEGKDVKVNGMPSRVPACKSCHGWNGIGRAPMYPRIGQQRYTYLVNQLKAWRRGAQGDKENGRSNDFAAQMRQVAARLSDQDIYDVAAYLMTAPVTTVGNDRVPDYTGMMTHSYKIVGLDKVKK